MHWRTISRALLHTHVTSFHARHGHGTRNTISQLVDNSLLQRLRRQQADCDDQAVYIRLCLKEILFGQTDLRDWQARARQILAAPVLDCRGVCDALARPSLLMPRLKDKKSELEALELKQSLVACETHIRCCQSAAQLGDVVTKDSYSARALLSQQENVGIVAWAFW